MKNLDQNTAHPKIALPRPLYLALPLGLLAATLFVVSGHAVVTSETQTTLDQFDKGAFNYTGLLDIPASGVDSVQLLPIGLTGDWFTTTPLPVRLADMAAATHGDALYIIGGADAGEFVRDEVYSTTMIISGGLTGWAEQTASPLPEGRAGAGSIVHEESATLYVVGGGRPSDYRGTDTVYRAPLDGTTGAVGSWQLDAQPLPAGVIYPAVIEHGDYLYVIGGLLPSLTATDTVAYAPINPDGSLGAFHETSALPEPLYGGYAVVYEETGTDTLYLIGGRNALTSTFKVYFAEFDSNDGSLTSWTLSDGNLPLHLYSHSGVLLRGEIILTGGIANAAYPGQGISNTVKAALVDPTNPSFRLYDWCLGTPPPTCTVGAWQTGGLLPEVRAFHQSTTAHGFVYVIGGVDEQLDARDSVYYITVNGAGGLYSPEGTYRSDTMHLSDFPATLRKVTWHTTIDQPDQMGLTMQFRHSTDGSTWSPWTAERQSTDGPNEFEFPVPPPSDARYFQYHAYFSTVVSVSSPLLDELVVFYELADPDLQVTKDTGSVVTVPLGSTLMYTIHYTNTGHWPAPATVLTETVPENATYAGGPAWQPVGPKTYIYAAGDVPPESGNSVPFEIQVNNQVPAGTRRITNTIETDFAPFVDAFGRTIIDPVPLDNWFQLGTDLSIFGIDVAKRADPPAGSEVNPGALITYTIAYTNTGMRAANHVLITDTFDQSGGYTVLEAVPQPNHGSNSWYFDNLRAGMSGTIQIRVQVSDPLPNHWILTNQAEMASAEGAADLPPIVTHTVTNTASGAPVPMPDLIVENLWWEPTTPTPDSTFRFYATVANVGTAAIDPSTAVVELYIKPQPSSPPAGPSDHERGFCLNNCSTVRQNFVAWLVGLAPGERQTVSFQNLEPDPTFPSPGCYDIYVQVDTSFAAPGYNPYWGYYAENYETNNLANGALCTEGSPMLYLPIIASGY